MSQALAPQPPSRPLLRWLSPGLLSTVLLLFFFSFVTVQCDDDQPIHLTGVDLATGNGPLKDLDNQKPNPYAAAALVLTVVGLGLAIANRPRLTATAAALALGALLGLLIDLNPDHLVGRAATAGPRAQPAADTAPPAADTERENELRTTLELPYWGAVLGLAAVVVLNLVASRAARRVPDPTP